MSSWYPVDSEDIDIDFGEKEVDLYVFQDDGGSVYATLTFLQIKEIYDQIIGGSLG